MRRSGDDSLEATVVGRASSQPGAVDAPADPAPPLRAGDMLAARYQVVRLLGRGGMGEVFQARDLELGIPVALKTLRPALALEERLLRGLKREVLLARSISHPGICRIHDFGRDRSGGRDLSFFTMELLPGESLRERLVARGRLSLDEALAVVSQVAAALDAAHGVGVVHRDFKSANVMLVPAAAGVRAVVTDFGLAATFAAGPGEADAGEAGRVLGTPAYMSPEQVRGERAGPAADLYALGVVLYELVTGRLPFLAATAAATAAMRLDEAAPSPRRIVPDLDPRWEAVILRCLARDPGERFARAGDVVRALGGEDGGDGAAAAALPPERDAFFGREPELAALASLVESSRRAVTLLGPAGSGKSRLAIHFGWATRERWPGGVFLADLRDARGQDGIVSAVAAALSVTLGSGDPVAQLGHALAGRGRVLLVLDNFDQVAGAAEETLTRWLARAAEARFVVTSRVRLGLAGEDVLSLDPLDQAAARALFVERAQAARPGFAMDAADEPCLAEVVRRLDGLPLALELAAARARVMTVRQIAGHLDDRFRLLAGGREGTRHATLRAAIDGSWELLRPWERQAFAQAAVFEGGFTLEAAEAVLDLGRGEDVPWVVDVVQALVDRSLLRVRAVGGGGEPRFSMYVSLQEYARERLEGLGTADAAAARHARFFARFGGADEVASLERHGGFARLRQLGFELDNLVAACRRAAARGEGATAVAALAAAWQVLEDRGPYATGVALARSVLEIPDLEPASRARAAYLSGRGQWLAGRPEGALEHLDLALALYRGQGDRRGEGEVLRGLGNVKRDMGEMAASHEAYEGALTLCREVGNRQGEGWVLGMLGLLHHDQGRIQEAADHYHRSLAVHREVGNRRGEGMVVGNLGMLRVDQGRVEEGRRHLECALAIHREVASRRFEGAVLCNLSEVSLARGRLGEARAELEQALVLAREVGWLAFEGAVLGNLAVVAHAERSLDEARGLCECALAIHREVGNRGFEGAVLGDLAAVLRDEGRLEEAARTYAEAERLLRALDDRLELAKLLAGRGELELKAGDDAAARASLAESESIAAGVGAGGATDVGRRIASLREALVRALAAANPA